MAKKSVEQIIKEHWERKKKLNAKYDPIRGDNSPIPRFKWFDKDFRADHHKATAIYLPLEMKFDNLFSYILKNGWENAKKTLGNISEEDMRTNLHHVRCVYDFEYWCATSCTIESDMGVKGFMVLNIPQRISLGDLEKLRTGGKPVRTIELKHRQYGSTTMKNAYVFWLQNVVYQNYKAYVCSLDSSGATKIVGRYEVIAKNYPEVLGKVTLKRYMGLLNTFLIPQTNALVNIGSAQNPNAPSGDTIQIALLSEVGKMKSTLEKGADKLITNIASMVKMDAHTFIMIESTAEKSGAWFRSQVFKARTNKGESSYHLTFISWTSDAKYQMEVPEEEVPKFAASLTEYEIEKLWRAGATLDQINWYRIKSGEYDNDWQMKQEFPTDIDEAFEGAGKKVFTPAQIQACFANHKKPLFIGDVVSKTGATIGPDCLKELEFVPDARGPLQIWAKPGEPSPGEKKYISDRYCSFVDIGGTTPESDYSVISIADRYWQTMAGNPERAAMWRGHCDPDQLAWKSAQVCKWYHDALMAVEVNSLYSRGRDGNGVSYLTIFQEITDHYRNVFYRQDATQAKDTYSKYGFLMNKSTKDQLVDAFRKGLREGSWIEYSQIVAEECSMYIINDETGAKEAMQGGKDDALVGAMGVNWLATSYMEPPRIIDEIDMDEINRKKRLKTEASI